MGFKLSKKHRLIAIICISFSFFLAEIASMQTNSRTICPLLTFPPVAFLTKSLALLADAFHYVIYETESYQINVVSD